MPVEVTQQLRDWYSKPYSADPCDPRYLVSSSDERGAAEALRSAMGVWGRIDEDGRIYEDWDLDLDEASVAHYMSRVYRLPEGLYVWADTQGVLTEAMARQWIEALVAALDERGVDARISLPPTDALERGVPYEFDFPTGVTSDTATEDEERKHYILRSVDKLTTDGRRYAENEVWSVAGGWSEDGSTAEGFDEPPLELLQQLRAEPRPENVHAPYGLFLPRWRLADHSGGPPEHLRQ